MFFFICCTHRLSFVNPLLLLLLLLLHNHNHNQRVSNTINYVLDVDCSASSQPHFQEINFFFFFFLSSNYYQPLYPPIPYHKKDSLILQEPIFTTNFLNSFSNFCNFIERAVVFISYERHDWINIALLFLHYNIYIYITKTQAMERKMLETRPLRT